MFLLLIFLVGSNALNCVDFGLTFTSERETIPMNERPSFIISACTSIESCHHVAPITDAQQHITFIEHCLNEKYLNFNASIFTSFLPIVDTFIKSKKTLQISKEYYDVLNHRAKSQFDSILTVVRLRESYIRQYEYKDIQYYTGDVFVLVDNAENTFQLHSTRQIDAIASYKLTSKEQWKMMNKTFHLVDAANEQLIEQQKDYYEALQAFDNERNTIDKYIISSMLIL